MRADDVGESSMGSNALFEDPGELSDLHTENYESASLGERLSLTNRMSSTPTHILTRNADVKDPFPRCNDKTKIRWLTMLF